jgi:DNA-binding transcriptional ArsR family regulator
VWQRQDSTRELIEGDWRDLSETIAALSHPMRLEILKHALGQDRSTQDFMALPDMGTTGQLFHHIKALQDAGWLRSLQRGLYGVPGERVVPLLAILAAARG